MQSINKRNYTVKEILFMYLSHIDDEAHTTAKIRLHSQLPLTPTPIPIHLCVPGIAVTLSQMSSDKSINSSYINKTADEYQDYMIEENSSSGYDTSTEIVNYTRNQPSQNGNFKPTRQLYQRNWSPPRMIKNSYKGSCMACGREGHHDGTCYFLMKVRQCILYLKDNPKVGDEKAAKYRQQSASNYKHRRAKIRSLREDNFLKYLVDTKIDMIYIIFK